MSGKLIMHFESSGLHTTIQDGGRSGFQDQAVPVGGVMDRAAYQLANQLVGNRVDTPVLEVTLSGPKIRFEGAGQLALTGGDLSPELNGVSVSRYETIVVGDGDVLRFGEAVEGCRTYLAVRGEWDVLQWMGSVSPLPAVGFMGGVIRKRDALVVKTTNLPCDQMIEPFVSRENKNVLRVWPGPEANCLGEDWSCLVLGAHRVSNQSNRMGITLTSAIQVEQSVDMISSGVFPGVIQLTSGGQFIILAADSQTTGGYPRVAVIADEDMDKLAQFRPGDELIFVEG
ncbi:MULTISPECIES: biotin-dependent carboxyltransferase family protein [Reichenbachiella]|uniref:Antagonist of KipI n=1 Tax=Reichenbachiella agariperforans TaxID=156994 RepID=A0A1M6LPI1_REIAG|nr:MULTISPECIES: biotin-dependent carboxyltransferase family protein [Reichenbachiella]RJE74090.1 hypothetical protein BGP76_12910 [Reichenbachiella sp. MSK19-1]SHJ72992.1 antagonist of KipI [Reichenbachiella agariperforans]